MDRIITDKMRARRPEFDNNLYLLNMIHKKNIINSFNLQRPIWDQVPYVGRPASEARSQMWQELDQAAFEMKGKFLDTKGNPKSLHDLTCFA